MRTLLIEDDEGSLLLLTKVLRNIGCRVSTVSDSAQAWQCCSAESFDLVLLAWSPPGSDRLELCRRIRRLSWGQVVEIIVVTACDRAEELQRVLDAGADDYLAKPIAPEGLGVRLRIAAHHHKTKLERAAAEKALLSAHDDLEQRVAERTAELIEANIALQRSEAKHRSLVENISDIVFSLDDDFRFRYVSPVISRVTGHQPAELIGTPIDELVHQQDRDRLEDYLTSSNRAKKAMELRFVARDGREMVMRVSFGGARDEARLPGFTGILSDITELKLLEQRLQLAQKMEAIGQFASGIAHDFNNLTMVLLTTADVIRSRVPEDDPVQKELAFVTATSRQAADLSRSLLAFARRERPASSTVSLDDLVAEMVPILKRLLPHKVILRHRRCAEIGKVRVDRARLSQVIMNLGANARDAMPEGGTILFETGSIVVDRAFVERHSGSREGRHSFLSVRDTGVGMDQQTLARVFDPFFTTKEPGQGTGLGLASVYSAVKQHDGMISVASSPGVGTNFIVFLPEVEDLDEVEEPAVERPSPVLPETVLLVDDSEEYRDVLAGVLESHGFRVVGARDGSAAMKILSEPGSEVGLIVSDFEMPELDGAGLYRASREKTPDTAFLFCSGHAAESTGVDFSRDQRVAFIRKPFGAETLVAKIAEILESEKSEGSDS